MSAVHSASVVGGQFPGGFAAWCEVNPGALPLDYVEEWGGQVVTSRRTLAAAPEPPPDRPEPEPSDSSWQPVDLRPFLDGSYRPPVPALLRRRDGVALLYPGRVHWCSGEPEALKSWFALLACAQVLQAGRDVVFLDMEDGAGGIVSRLLALGAPATVIEQRFAYLAPDQALSLAARQSLEGVVRGAALFVIDAATESLSMQGLNDKDGVDIARWLELLPRWARARGPAVLVLDHVVKDTENRGRWATGSGHKLAGLDGVAYQLEAVAPAGIGLTGRSRLYEVKDRHGQVRRHVTPTAGGRRWAGDLVVASLHDAGDVEVVLHPPTPTEGAFQPTVVMERVSAALAAVDRPLSGRDVEDRVNGKASTVRQALALLVDSGHVDLTHGSHNSKLHRLVRPYPDVEETS